MKKTLLIKMLRSLPVFLLMALFWGTPFTGNAQGSGQDRITVTGTVVDGETNEGLPGVSVLEKGTTNGTATDVNGQYTVVVSQGAVLVFSSIGYQSQEVTVSNQSKIDVGLDLDIQSLEEVVVIGYGTVKKSDLTGSVVTVDQEVIKEANKVNSFQAIQGQVPGVDIQASSNKPGGGFNVRIRGANTVNKTESGQSGGFSPGQNPLFVVDGIFVDDISWVNPADIAQMDVLKDASATAIYGARGSAGVVIITTKKAESGKLSIQYDNYFGIKRAYNLPDMFDGPQFVQFMRDAVVGIDYSGGNFSTRPEDVVLENFLRPNEITNINNGSYTDWIDLMLESGFQTNHTVNLSGGQGKTSYGLGVGYTLDEGTFPGESYERFNLRTNLTSALSDRFTLSYNGYVTYDILDEGSREGFRSAYRLRPTGSPFDANGDPLFFPIESETFITNPLFEEANIIRETKTLRYVGNLSLSFEPVKGLKFTSSFSPNLEAQRYGEYRGLFSKSVSNRADRRRAQVNHTNTFGYTWDNIIDYSRSFGADHEVKVGFISSLWKQEEEVFQTQVRDFTTDEFLFYNQDAGADIRTLSGNLVEFSIASFSARANYTFKQKYLLTLTGRYDGASLLADGNRWEFFPSAAFAWRVKDEPFLSGVDVLSDAKLRVSYGEVGNTGASNGLVPLQSQSNIEQDFTNLGDEAVPTAFFANIPNDELSWERTQEINFGLDFGLFSNRIVGTLDVYNRKTSDLIQFRDLPDVSGFGGIWQNIGEVRNRGVELYLKGIPVDAGDLKWTVSLNFAKNNNELLSLNSNATEELFSVREAEMINRVGEELGSMYWFEAIGVWQADEVDEAQRFGQQPGQVKVKDQDDNGVINDLDRTILGSQAPDWTGGLTNTLNYKNFDFTVFAYTRQGVMNYSWFHRSHGWDADDRPARFNGWNTNYWTPDNPTNDWHQPGNSGPHKRALFYQDVSFVKVGYITLGYSFPNAITESLNLGSLRVYAMVQNPFVFTDYEGWDPENAGRNSWGAAHLTRSFLAGVNVRF